jgi:hypothetical protein
MNEHDRDHLKKLLKRALLPVDADRGPSRDLWPAMLRRLNEEPAMQVSTGGAGFNWAWFDGALAAGLLLLVVSFPASIPLLLYYL